MEGAVTSRRLRGNPRRTTASRAGALALALLGLVCSAEPIAAQTGSNAIPSPGPLISIPRTLSGSAATQISLPVEIGPTATLPANCFVRVRGLPISVSLSEGHAIAPGSWAIPLASLANLKANLPVGQAGQSAVTVQLVSVDGAVLAETQTTLVIKAEPAAPKADVPARADVLGPSPPAGAGKTERKLPIPRPPELSAEERQRAERMMAQGDKFLESGNIEIARQFYQRAADAGFAAGALRLAATYDPGELARLSVQVVPSPAEARRWYQRAKELGAAEAEERLVRLGK